METKRNIFFLKGKMWRVTIITGILILTILVTPIMADYIQVNNISLGSNYECTKEEIGFEDAPSVEEQLQFMNIISDDVAVIEKDKSEMTCKVEFEDTDGVSTISYVESVVDENGNVVMQITEEGKTNTIIIDKDGSMLVDGKPIIAETEVVNPNNLFDNGCNMAYAGHRMYTTPNAPYGRNSDYTKSFATEKRKLALAKDISAITVFVFGIALMAAGWTGLIISGALFVYQLYVSHTPRGRAFSMMNKQEVHKTKGYQVSSHMCTYENNVTYYARDNYTAKIGSEYFFRVFTF